MQIDAKVFTQQEKGPKKKSAKKRFFSKKAREIELLKPVPESSHQTGSFSVSQHIGRMHDLLI